MPNGGHEIDGAWWQWALGAAGAIGAALAEGYRRGKSASVADVKEATEALAARALAEHQRTRAEVEEMFELVRNLSDLVRNEHAGQRRIFYAAMQRFDERMAALDRDIAVLMERGSRGQP